MSTGKGGTRGCVLGSVLNGAHAILLILRRSAQRECSGAVPV